MVFVAQTLESVGIGAQTPGVGERIVGAHNRVDAVYVGAEQRSGWTATP